MSALTLWMLGYADQVLQRSQEALAQAVMAVAREHGFTQWFMVGIVRRGWALAVQGHRATGAEGGRSLYLYSTRASMRLFLSAFC
jgi:hypothetical protein